jgi:hypothetical protein
MGINEVKIAPRTPWRNPYCERVSVSIRRQMLDYAVVLNKRRLRRVLRSSVDYDHAWRVPRCLNMDSSHHRPVQLLALGLVMKLPEVGGSPPHWG